MSSAIYVPESELVAMLLRQIDDVKRRHPEWASPHRLSRVLGIRLVVSGLGQEREGAALDDTIVVDLSDSGQARQYFTLYHEIVHHLLKGNDGLLSIMHDQYRSEGDFGRVCERLCNIGAAEFLLPREAVLSAIREAGFSLALLRGLAQTTPASLAAICVQLVLCATHRCIGVVCRAHPMTESTPLPVSERANRDQLRVETAISSATMNYGIARGTVIPTQHLLWAAHESVEGDMVRGHDAIPFRNPSKPWIVECEAVRIGSQVFGFFHADPPPKHLRDQLRLF